MATALPIATAKLIDVGTTANDGTGDQLRTAFEKTNAIAVEGVVVQPGAPAALWGVAGDIAGMIATDGADVWVCFTTYEDAAVPGTTPIWFKIDVTQLDLNTTAIGTNTTNIGTNDTDIAANLASIVDINAGDGTVAGAAPASAGDTGTAGQVAFASGFVYVCVATNTWQRAVIATW